MQVAVIGAGLMGHGMAANLLKHGHDVRVMAHCNRAPIENLVERGAVEATSIAELVASAEVILICVSSSRIVEDIIGTLKPHLSRGMVVLDSGTSEPRSSVNIAGALQTMGVAFADIPLTGGPEQAEQGQLGVLCGADEAIFERIKPLLACFASTIRHMGPVGSGHTAKLISNFLVTGMVALVAEAFAAARKAQIDWRSLYEAMLNGSGNSGVLRKMAGPAIDGDFDGYRFSLANGAKDIAAYAGLASELGCASALTDAVAEVFGRAVKRGDGGLNVSHLLKPAAAPSHRGLAESESFESAHDK